MSMENNLQQLIFDYEQMGCRRIEDKRYKMPDGYALMLNRDESHYFWLRHDGTESVIHWNRAAVYRMAKMESGA